MSYILTEDAEEDIIHILAESGKYFGLRQARSYYAGLMECFSFLGDNPRAARERAELTPPVRAHPYGSHIVIYKTDGEEVIILAVRHSRENWQEDL
jgi:toxin ParE1/3/4